jgi:hypothetical protein
MAMVTKESVAAFRAQGYVVIPGVLDQALLARGRELAGAMLAADPPPPGHAGPYFLWPHFQRLRLQQPHFQQPRSGAGGHELLAFYRDAGIGPLARGLLRAGLDVEEPGSAQLAITFPPWPHRPGGPHVDGLTPPEADGRPGTFSMLAGVWLTDHCGPDQGNLYIWPGSHLGFGSYLAERGADALSRVEEMNPGPYPDIELGEPVQVTGPAGSVLFAHYLLAHNIGGHDGRPGAPARQTVYFRLHASGHRSRWRTAVTSPLAEFR